MRVISRANLVAFARRHPKAASAVRTWETVVRAGQWKTMNEVQTAFSKARVLNSDRVRFEIGDGNRLVAAFDFGRQVVFIKFIGTHAEYDQVDALTVSQF